MHYGKITLEMERSKYKAQYRRNLPHIQPIGATLFVTIRLVGSLPVEAVRRLQNERNVARRKIEGTKDQDRQKALFYDEEKRHFGRCDSLLDQASCGPTWLELPEVAATVHQAFLEHDRILYDLIAFVIMPNHAHAVFRPLEEESGLPYSLATIMRLLKGRTAYTCNRILARSGQFWQHESYDHVVRDRQELDRIVAYILHNPVKAGLVESWEQWPWIYIREEAY